MELVKKAEVALEGLFKGAPKLSDSTRETLAKIWPWLALAFGIIQLFLAWGLWGITRWTLSTYNVANDYYRSLTGTDLGGISSFDKMLLYLGIVMLLIDAVILLMAFPKLQKRLRAGWDLVFLGALINLVYGVFSLFLHGRGVGSLLGTLVGSAIGFYLLFQVKDKFNGGAAKAVASAHGGSGGAAHSEKAAPKEEAPNSEKSE